MNFEVTPESIQKVLHLFTRYVAENPASETQRPGRNLAAMEHALTTMAAEQRQDRADFFISARQYEVLKMFSEGMSFKQIAFELKISDTTVRSHAGNIYKALGVNDRARAAQLFNEGRVMIAVSRR